MSSSCFSMSATSASVTTTPSLGAASATLVLAGTVVAGDVVARTVVAGTVAGCGAGSVGFPLAPEAPHAARQIAAVAVTAAKKRRLITHPHRECGTARAASPTDPVAG